MLFIRTKTQSANFWGNSLYWATKQDLNGEQWNEKLNHLSVVGWALLFFCPVLGRMASAFFQALDRKIKNKKWFRDTQFLLLVWCLKAVKTQPKQDKSFSFIIFDRLSVVWVLFCGLIKGISPKMCILCACVKMNKPSLYNYISDHQIQIKFI